MPFTQGVCESWNIVVAYASGWDSVFMGSDVYVRHRRVCVTFSAWGGYGWLGWLEAGFGVFAIYASALLEEFGDQACPTGLVAGA